MRFYGASRASVDGLYPNGLVIYSSKKIGISNMTDTSEITSGNNMIGATLALAQHYKASRGIQDISYDLLAATAIISRGSLGYNEEEFLAAAKYIWKMTQEDSTDHTQ